MGKLSSVVLMATAASLMGCTTALNTKSNLRTTSNFKAVPGVSYPLPMLQFDLNVTRTLTQCETVARNLKGEIVSDKGIVVTKKNGLTPGKMDEIAFSVGASAKEVYIPGETYVLDHKALASASKISSIVLEFHEGSQTLKSVNASAEDKSAEIIKNTVSTAINVAAIAAGVPLGVDALASTPDYLICSSDTKKTLTKMKNLEVSIRTLASALKVKTKELNTLTESLKPIAIIGAISAAQKRAIADLMIEQRDLMIRVEVAKKGLENEQKLLVHTATIKWPQVFSDLASGTSPPFYESASDKRKWASLFQGGGINNTINKQFCELSPVADNANLTTLEKQTRESEVFHCLDTNLSLTAIIMPALTHSRASIIDGNSAAIALDAEGVKGFVYRQPDPGYLKMCLKNDADGCILAAKDVVFKSAKPISVPQLGQLRFIEFENKSFQNNKLVVLLRENGALEKFEYSDVASSGAALAGALNDTTSQIGSYLIAKKTFEIEQEENELAAKKLADENAKAALEGERLAVVNARADQLATLQFELDLLKKEKEIQELIFPQDTTAIDAINSQTAIINANVALLSAQSSEIEALNTLSGID